MQSSKSTKKSPEQNLATSEPASPVETAKSRRRPVKAAGSSESKLVASSAKKTAAKTSATVADKSTPKTKLHRSSKRATLEAVVINAEVAPQVESPVTVAATPAEVVPVIAAIEVAATAEDAAAIEGASELIAMASALGPSEMAAETPAPRVITRQEIAELAYSYFVARGDKHGNEQEDWFRAEHELRSRR